MPKICLTLLITLTLLLTNSSLSGYAAQGAERPFLAVWCTPGFEAAWPSYSPDYLYVAHEWEKFDDFLKDVRRKAGNRPIDLDIEAHGLQYLSLDYLDWATGKMVSKQATMGYVLNHIEKHLKGKKFTLYIESCYGGNVYKGTIRNNVKVPGVMVEDHPKVPTYPVWGGTFEHINVANMVYIQQKTQVRYATNDLRRWETEEGPPLDFSDGPGSWIAQLEEIWSFLCQYYKP